MYVVLPFFWQNSNSNKTIYIIQYEHNSRNLIKYLTFVLKASSLETLCILRHLYTMFTYPHYSHNIEGGEGKDNLIKDPVFRERERGRKKKKALHLREPSYEIEEL